MSPWGYDVENVDIDGPEVPEPTQYVDELQTPPLPRQFTWSPDTMLILAGVAVALGFAIWFLMSFTGAKARALAEAVNDATSA